MLALGAGLKPQEYITVVLPKEGRLWVEYKNPVQTFVGHLKEKIEEMGVPYDVYVRDAVIYVVGRGVIA
jgi:hypothetical protein